MSGNGNGNSNSEKKTWIDRYRYRYRSSIECDDDSVTRKGVSTVTRRSFSRSMVLAGSAGGCLGLGLSSQAAVAAAAGSSTRTPRVKGAAEYDLEYYLRDLVKGNKLEGNLPVSTAPPTPTPRTLTQPLLSLLLDDACTAGCVPVQILQRMTKGEPGSITNIQQSVARYRAQTARGFSARAQWQTEHVTDQYYFDITSYALWRTAADLMPTNYTQRSTFVQEVGRELYRRGVQQGMFTATISTAAATKSNPTDAGSSIAGEHAGPLTRTMTAMTEVLRVLNDTSFCSSFRISTGTEADAKIGGLPFDALDDADILVDTKVNCLLSVYNPATLGAALQITGEGSRFIPDFVGCTLAAMWEEYGIKATYETYFVDPVYRPNPKDYFPDEQLYQFTLSRL